MSDLRNAGNVEKELAKSKIAYINPWGLWSNPMARGCSGAKTPPLAARPTVWLPAWTTSPAHNWAHHLCFPQSPPVAKRARNTIFRWRHVLFHPSHLSYHLPAPLPDNSTIIVIVVSVWIVLFLWQVSLNRKTWFQTHRPHTPRWV